VHARAAFPARRVAEHEPLVVGARDTVASGPSYRPIMGQRRRRSETVDQAAAPAAVRHMPLLDGCNDGPDVLDPTARLRSGKIEARSFAERVGSRRRASLARSFTRRVIATYWTRLQVAGVLVQLAPAFEAMDEHPLPPEAIRVAESLGAAASRLDSVVAGYYVGTTYAAMLPKEDRARLGAYYTPPALTDRLLDQATAAGVGWASASVLDPACGGGAFLAPIAIRMVKHLSHLEPEDILHHIGRHLRGFEIDAFAAWIARVFLDAALLPVCRAAKQRPAHVIEVGDALRGKPDGRFDAVVGNPPYGRVTLAPHLRHRYDRSLYGHANLYGVFTDLALRWAAPDGVVSFVTPASFLAGQYFRRLRTLLAGDAPPAGIDFIEQRKGVFDDVLQEAVLVTYSRKGKGGAAAVNFVRCADENTLTVASAGTFSLPADSSQPWLVPRDARLQSLVDRLRSMPHRLADWGYSVSTGPLVWNRHRRQLRAAPGKGTLPLVWAEAITGDGRFIFRANRRNHRPYFKPGPGDEWLVVREPVVLLQRTTAKEQSRRLIAAEMSRRFISEHGGAVVENHLNMVRPILRWPLVPSGVATAFFNSGAADKVFRCLSGSVAVSAYELEAMPLPPPASLGELRTLVERGAPAAEVERACERLYGLVDGPF